MPSQRLNTVNKFGGKNMSQLDQVGSLVDRLIQRNEKITLVVSAFNHVTNALISAYDSLGNIRGEEDVYNAFSPVRKLHEDIIDKYFVGALKDKAVTAYDEMFDVLIYQLTSTATTVSPRTHFNPRDEVMGFGERMSARFLELYLESRGQAATFIDDVDAVGEMTTGDSVSVTKLHAGIRKGIAQSIEKADQTKDTRANVIRILGGHVGDTPRGIVTDVGRSYSDTTAIHTAYALRDIGEDVKVARFWKDVDGVMTANPKDLDPKANRALIQPHVSFTEGLEMASAGSGLMQIDALALAHEEEQKEDGHKGLKIELRNINDKEFFGGTVYSGKERLTHGPFKTIATKENTDAITITVPAMANRKGFISVITGILDKHDLSIDATPSEGTSLFFSFDLPPDKVDQEAMRERIQAACKDLEKLEVNGEIYCLTPEAIEWHQDLASVSLIGNEIAHHKNGALTWFASILAANDIELAAISHTTHQKRISAFVKKTEVKKAIQALHSILVDGDKEAISALIERRRTELDKLSQGFRM